jgi:hypothetical protein
MVLGTDQDPGRTKWLEIECLVLRGPTDQIRLAREWHHWKARGKYILRYRF